MKVSRFIILSFISFLLIGCNDSFLNRLPESLTDETFWETPEDLEVYVNRFYATLPSGLVSDGDGESDNQVPHTRPAFIWDEYIVPASAPNASDPWSKGDWLSIEEINHFMDNYQKVQGDPKLINQYVGEVRFFRAVQFASKINKFGDVPWFEKALNPSDVNILYGGKTKRNEVMNKILEDFDFAIQWLPEKPSAGRIGKDVARHMKARVCLHEGTYYKYHTELGFQNDVTRLLQAAVQAASEIMATKKYEIYSTGNPEKDFYNMFLIEDKNNLKEAILPVTYIKDVRIHNTSRALDEAKTGFSKDFVNSILCKDGKPVALSNLYKGDKTMLDEVTNRDPRFAQTIMTPGFPSRILNSGDSTFVTENDYVSDFCYTGYRIIKFYSPLEQHLQANGCTYDGIAYRYAETLLILAEAKAELGTITQDDLDKTINVLRDRVGMPHLTMAVGFTDPNWPNWGYSLSPILQEIRRERRVELAGEGFRSDDIKRWKAGSLLNRIETYTGKWIAKEKKYAEVYPGYLGKRKWNDRLYLYPIPTGEFVKNPKLLPQNPGWN